MSLLGPIGLHHWAQIGKVVLQWKSGFATGFVVLHQRFVFELRRLDINLALHSAFQP
jgi:hypothetical protein